MDAIISHQSLLEKKRFKHAIVSVVQGSPHIAVVTATTGYIPIDQFKEIFSAVTDLVKNEKITKLIFDKSTLTVFHQPSMEWYFVEWKEQMFELGLKSHRKILPRDEIFRQSVRIGREKISKQFPNGKFQHMDIQYADSLKEAILK